MITAALLAMLGALTFVQQEIPGIETGGDDAIQLGGFAGKSFQSAGKFAGAEYGGKEDEEG